MIAVYRLHNLSIECRYRKTSLQLPRYYHFPHIVSSSSFIAEAQYKVAMKLIHGTCIHCVSIGAEQ